MTKTKEDTTFNKLIVKRSAMGEEELKKTEEIVSKCFQQGKNEEKTAALIKDELEKNYGGTVWNVVIGKDFGSNIFHKSKFFANFKLQELEIVVWKC